MEITDHMLQLLLTANNYEMKDNYTPPLKLRLHSSSNKWVALDESGNEIFTFSGLHLADLFYIIKRVNGDRYETTC
jgi:hypothetical protein